MGTTQVGTRKTRKIRTARELLQFGTSPKLTHGAVRLALSEPV